MKFEVAINHGRCFDTVRWQDKFSIIFDLYKKGNSDVIQKHNKKKLKPICVLNSRGMEFEMPNSRVSGPTKRVNRVSDRKTAKKVNTA